MWRDIMTRTREEILAELKANPITIEEVYSPFPHPRRLVFNVPADSPVTAEEYVDVIKGVI